MNIKDEIKGLIYSSGLTITDVVNKLNETKDESEKSSSQNLSNKLSRGTLRYTEYLDIIKICGYRIKLEKIEK